MSDGCAMIIGHCAEHRDPSPSRVKTEKPGVQRRRFPARFVGVCGRPERDQQSDEPFQVHPEWTGRYLRATVELQRTQPSHVLPAGYGCSQVRTVNLRAPFERSPLMVRRGRKAMIVGAALVAGMFATWVSCPPGRRSLAPRAHRPFKN